MPASLRERILAAVNGEGGTNQTLPEILKQAGERLLAAARSGPASRDTALTLLAADALMTFACEVVAETAPERLGDVR